MFGVVYPAQALHLPQRQSIFRTASAKFRSSVLGALSGLYPIPGNWPSQGLDIMEVLKDRFPPLQEAVAEFRDHVPFLERWIFDRAWRSYRLGKEGREIDGQYYWQYVPHSGEGVEQGRHYKYDNTRTYKDDFKKNVDRLLSFAKET